MNSPPSSDETIFSAALALPAAERPGYLASACAGDPERRARIESLLDAIADAPDFMAASATPLSHPVEPATGDRIGRYKLLQKIGEGGIGVVFMAEQEEPVRRRVALKVIKLGMDTKEVIARFEAERQALALMEHPHIARVFDGGATEAGRPFFVMELVRGLPITAFCDEQNLPTRARLELFTQVCHAVQHAHQKGVIHRDLKPSNILVTLHDGVPVPKVIDFGIAKATQGKLTDATLFTAFEQFIGTPAYMSPEQAEMSGLDIDTRSDIYSLGVLLYELLTGRPPFDPKTLVQAGIAEIRRIIREVDPPRPSTRLSTLGDLDRATIAKQRGIVPHQLSTLLRGDLDWIVMRCLEKDRTRRYETANGLALDVLRHLHDEPVVARPPSTAYRLQKLFARNKLAVVVVAALAVSLLLGLGLSTWQYCKEKAARERAVAAEQKARTEATRSAQVTRFLEEMLKGVGPSVARGRNTTLLREILDQTAERIGRELSGQPEVEAELRMTLGSVYEQLGEKARAEGMFREALKVRQASLGLDDARTWVSMLSLARVLAERGNIAAAEKLLGESLAARERSLGTKAPAEPPPRTGRPAEPTVASLLAAVHDLQQHLLAARREKSPVEVDETARSLRSIGGIALLRGELDEAETALREALASQQKARGAEHPEIVPTLMNLGALDFLRGNYTAAETTWNKALVLQRRLTGPDDPGVANLLMNMGAVAMARRDHVAAGVHWREAMSLLRRILPAEHPRLAEMLDNLGGLSAAMDDPVAAEAAFRESLSIRRHLFGEHSPFVAYSLAGLGNVLQDQKRWADAEPLQREAIAIWEQNEPDDWKVHSVRNQLGGTLAGLGRSHEAEPLLVEGYLHMRRHEDQMRPDERHRFLRPALKRLVSFYAAANQAEKSAEWQATLDRLDSETEKTRSSP